MKKTITIKYDDQDHFGIAIAYILENQGVYFSVPNLMKQIIEDKYVEMIKVIKKQHRKELRALDNSIKHYI